MSKRERSDEEGRKQNKKVKLESNILQNKTSLPQSFLDYEQKRRIGKITNYPKKLLNDKLYAALTFTNRISCRKKDGIRSSCSDAVYNLEFSMDDKIMIASGAKSELLLFDPISHKRVKTCASGHFYGVNSIKFIDTRLFTTCSDDQTIAIWDLRKLSERVNTFKGHTGWVKDVTYIPSANKLVSSGFDDTIRVWNVNKSFNNENPVSNVVLDVKFLTRSALNGDFSKLVTATTTGHYFVIHNLDLETLKKDVNSELDLFLQEVSTAPQKSNSKRKQNLVEFLTDYPSTYTPWCITSVKTHGDQVLSRYSSMADNSEWTVIHDLRQTEPKRSRLKYYISEANAAAGFIKEVNFNSDGTLVCSPFGNGVRILSYNTACQQSASIHCARNLCEKKLVIGHKKPTLTSKFANDLPLIASGSIDGFVSFYSARF